MILSCRFLPISIYYTLYIYRIYGYHACCSFYLNRAQLFAFISHNYLICVKTRERSIVGQLFSINRLCFLYHIKVIFMNLSLPEFSGTINHILDIVLI